MINVFLFLLLTMPFSLMAQSSTDGLTTFILVRHAEKVDDSRDPDLSEPGYNRAENLAKMFVNVPIDVVYSTDFIRTQETARPIAELNDLNIQSYNPENPTTQVESWRETHRGETILVSGHSNSTPTFANTILGENHFESAFDESDYGNILIITISNEGEKKLFHLRY